MELAVSTLTHREFKRDLFSRDTMDSDGIAREDVSNFVVSTVFPDDQARLGARASADAVTTEFRPRTYKYQAVTHLPLNKMAAV